MKMPILQLGAAAVYGAAGFCVFLILLNRFLILLPSSRVKTPVILAAFAVLSGGGAVLGSHLDRFPWILAPAALLCLVLIGEGRRTFIRRSCAGSGPIATTPYRLDITRPITTTEIVVNRYAVPHPKWEGAPLRIVHVTDLHVHPALPAEYYRRVLDAAEQEKPDIAVFTGDFITSLSSLPGLRSVLRPVAHCETYAVLGNHDYWTDSCAVGSAVKESGLRLLSNESVRQRINGTEIAVTGYDYPWGTKNKRIAAQNKELLHIVLSHTPDNIYRIALASGDIVFSGHYHAGQIRMPVIGSIVIPSVYGRRFDHGHFIVNGCHLFVAAGIGADSPPVRIYCRPDIFVVDIMALARIR